MDDGLPGVGQMSPGVVDFFIVAGAILLVSFIAFIWITFFRKNKRRRRHNRQNLPKSYGEQLKQQMTDIKQIVKKDRYRNQEPQFLPNPTLAQTGGLPPIRKVKKTDSQDSQTPPPSP